MLPEDLELKTRQRRMWAAGDYHSFATRSLWDLGPLLVAACGISPGQRVLDVAAGTGNVAIRAAEAGAEVVACDLTPENFDAGRREARAHGVELEWVEADAEALPFADGEFDVVTSSFGAIFAPHHQQTADELVRVCRPAGTIGLITIAPTGVVRDLFELTAAYGQVLGGPDQSPLTWGMEDHVRELFGDRVETLRMERRPLGGNLVDEFGFFKSHHPLLVSLYRDLEDQPARMAELDRRLDELAHRWGGEHQECLLVIARKRGGDALR